MILLTRFPKGDRIALNPDLVERAEAIPDTVLTLTDGTRYVVAEGLDEFIEIVRHYRAGIIALSHNLQVGQAEPAHGGLRLLREHGDAAVEGLDHHRSPKP